MARTPNKHFSSHTGTSIDDAVSKIKSLQTFKKNNWEATSNPAITTNYLFGYKRGSFWYNSTGPYLFICDDPGSLASPDASWTNITTTSIPGAHGATHTDGTDDIQDATTGQKGLMTSAQATTLGTAIQAVDFNAYTILFADTDDTPAPLTISASTFVGRKASGGISSVTATEARTILNVENGATADQTDSEIETAYNNQVAQVTTTQKDESSDTTVRRFSPKDIADIAGTGDNIITDSTTARTLALTDSTRHIEMTNSSSITVTIPLNATVPLHIGFQCEIEQANVGVITFAPEGATVLHSKDSSLSSNGQYGSVMLKKKDTDTWLITGDLA